MFEYSPTPKTLVSLIPEEFHGKITEQLLVNDIQTDSREVSPGTLFVALKGLSRDGEKYISDAVENGAVAILVEDDHRTSVLNVEVPIIGIKDLKKNVSLIAERFFESPSLKLKLAGVTGTNGKSTITSLIAQFQSLLGIKAGVVGTLGYGVLGGETIETGMTTPDIVRCHRILADFVNTKTQCVAMEVSSHGIDQRRIERLRFGVGVISNITRDHLDYHGSFENYARVKKSFLLSNQCEKAVVNIDDEECLALLPELDVSKKPCVTFGIDNEKAEVRGVVKRYIANGIDVHIKTPWGSADVVCPLVGKHNLSNVLAALSACCIQGVSFNDLVEVMPQLHAVSGRLEKVDIDTNEPLPSVYIDYAHTPDALLQVLTAIKQHATNNLWVVFGCGGDRDKGKRPEMGLVASKIADRIIVTSDNPRTENPDSIIEGIMAGIDEAAVAESIVERHLAISLAIGSCDSNDVVLIAGKGHEDYQIIGHEKLPFSDYLIAQEALSLRSGSKRLAK